MLTKLHNLYTFLFALFCASLPFTNLAKAIPNILLGVLGALFFFVVRKEDFEKLRLKSLYMLGLMIIIGVFSVLVFQRWDDMSFIVRLLNILVIVLLSLPVKNYIIIIKAFVFSSLTLLAVSSVNLILYAKTSDSFDFTLGEHINDLLLGERPYLGMIYVASACICWFLASKTSGLFRFLWYFISLVFIVFVAVISARMALVSLFILLFGAVFYYKKGLKTAVGITGGILVLGFLLVSLNENLKNRFFIASGKDFVLSEKLVHEPRYHIWECAFGLDQNTTSFFLGKGFKQTETELVSCYETRGKFYTADQQQWFIKKRFNTHNQYLGVYYCMGAIAFLCFIGFLFFTLAENRKNHYATALVILLLLFLLSENLIYRQIGIMYIGITLVLARLLRSEKM